MGEVPPPPPPPYQGGPTPPAGGPPPPSPVPPQPVTPAPPAKQGSNRGCMIALVVLLILGLLGGAAAVVGIVFVGRAVDDAVDDATGGQGLGGMLGGECVEFQMAYLSISFTGMLGAGADDAQREEIDAQLGELEDLVPAEIEGDFEVVSTALREAMAVGTGGAGFVGGVEPSEEAQQEATAILEDPEVVAAQENINAWVEQNCA